jgi:hypothetical protein
MLAPSVPPRVLAMFEGLFGQEDDESSWEASPPVVSRGGKAPVSGRGHGQTPFIGLSNQYVSMRGG